MVRAGDGQDARRADAGSRPPSQGPRASGPRSAGLDLPSPGEPDPRTRHAVVFLLDRAYLTPLRVLLHTLQGAVRERACDLVVITNDRAVAEDGFVTTTADRVILLSDEDIAAVASVRRDAVGRRLRHKGVGKYTFLKLLAYDDLGYRGHLFLDVDMICLDPGFRFEELFFEDCDFAVAPPVGPARLRLGHHAGSARGSAGSPQEREMAELIFTGLLRYRSRRLREMNSGVFFAGHRLLRRSTVDRMLDTAREKAFRLEQLISLEVLSKTRGLQFRALGVRYNAPELPLYAMGEDHFERVRDRHHVPPLQRRQALGAPAGRGGLARAPLVAGARRRRRSRQAAHAPCGPPRAGPSAACPLVDPPQAHPDHRLECARAAGPGPGQGLRTARGPRRT